MKLCEQIYKFRCEKKLSQSELAEECKEMPKTTQIIYQRRCKKKITKSDG